MEKLILISYFIIIAVLSLLLYGALKSEKHFSEFIMAYFWLLSVSVLYVVAVSVF